MAKQLAKDAADVAALIDEAEANGEEISETWLLQQQRWQTLLAQVNAQIEQYSSAVAPGLTERQRSAVEASLSETASVYKLASVGGDDLTAAVRVFNILPVSAVETLIGFAHNGSPLQDVFRRIAPDLADQLSQTLIDGFAAGKAAKTVAAELRAVASDLGRTRSQTIARTTINTTYREASRRSYQANAGLIRGYIRLCAMDSRSCLACIALHGQHYDLGEFMPSHASCRCYVLPSLPGGAGDLILSGEAIFATMPEARRREILGPARMKLYQDGTPLSDFVSVVDDPDWGPTTRIKPVKSL